VTAAAAGAGSGAGRPGWLRAWGAWLALAVVVVGVLAFGTLAQDDPTPAERAQNLAETIRCPSCKSQSAASSDTPSSAAVRAEIRRRIAAGESDEEIRDFLASRYGREILLDPSGSGFGTLVWALPVGFVVVAVAGLVVRFRQDRPSHRHASAEDRDLVDRALHGDDPDADADGDAEGGADTDRDEPEGDG
jgi:cytochrome c-type biogenesis protein CcmH